MWLYYLPPLVVVVRMLLRPIMRRLGSDGSISLPGKRLPGFRVCFFVIFDLTLIFPLVHQVFVVRENLLILGDFESWYQKGSLFRQPGTMDSIRLWKDPWSEKLIVI